MALEAPLRSSTGNLISPFSPFKDMSVISSGRRAQVSPLAPTCFHLDCVSYRSPALTMNRRPRSTPTPMDSQSLRPTSYVRPHSAHLLSPSSDIVGPSPVTSNGTETTEIDDEALSETSDQPSASESEGPPQVWDHVCRSCYSLLIPAQLKMLRTNLPDAMRTNSSEGEAVSVIHAPESFHQWVR